MTKARTLDIEPMERRSSLRCLDSNINPYNIMWSKCKFDDCKTEVIRKSLALEI